MHSDLEILVNELKQIQENNNNFNLTHSDIRSFIKAFIAAVNDGIIQPFCNLSREERDRIMLHLNLIRAYGIPHVDRSRMAAKTLSMIKEFESKKKLLDTQNDRNDKDWDDIPF